MKHQSWDAEKIGSVLDWKQFEVLAEEAFRSFGYETKRNVRLRKPTMELDLLAWRGSIAFAIDCKHWKRTVGNATMLKIALKQSNRSARAFEVCDCDQVIPLVLTLHDEMLYLLDNGVAIVPISKVSDFILNWESFKDSMCILNSNGEHQQKLGV